MSLIKSQRPIRNNPENFAALLLAWYDQHKRTLPWRGSKDPYVIWISEIIFQQTRIEQGTTYYLKFIERFPTIACLAVAGEDEVLRLWQGLGYYSRARNLLFTARYILDQHQGIFPQDFESIRKLKGIGDYTASCIASICYNQPHAAVDGNVYRVLSRSFADATPIDTPAGKVFFKKLAQSLISPERPGDFNEALMDLGSQICKPRNPLCTECPLKELCKARAKAIQMDFPVKSPALKRPARVLNYLLISPDNQVLIRKRAGNGIWKGLYELPLVTGEMNLSDIKTEYLKQYGLEVDRITEVKRVKQMLTHAELDIRFYTADDVVNEGRDENLLSVPVKKITQYPFPKPLVDFLSGLEEG